MDTLLKCHPLLTNSLLIQDQFFVEALLLLLLCQYIISVVTSLRMAMLIDGRPH